MNETTRNAEQSQSCEKEIEGDSRVIITIPDHGNQITSYGTCKEEPGPLERADGDKPRRAEADEADRKVADARKHRWE